VFTLLAIVLPAATVAVLGYVSLRQWQRSAELLSREQARDVAAMAADKVDMVLRAAEDDALARLQAVLSGRDASEPALDDFTAAAPIAQRLYVLDREGRVVYPRVRGGDAPVIAALRAQLTPGWSERTGRREVVAGETSVLTAVLRDGRGPLLIGIVRSADGLRRQVLESLLPSPEAPTIYAIVDAAGHPVYSQRPLEGAELVAAVPFRNGFPGWRVAIYQPRGTSPVASVRRQVAIGMGALAVLIVVIAAGVVAVGRLVRRETEMAQLKADFVANVSHDLKTPLSVIRMYGETLEMGRVRDDATRQEYYRVITRESERLTRLIDNVLDFSRIEGGRRRYDLAPTAIEPLVRETLDAFAYPLGQHGFKVDVDIASDLPEVPMDADAVGQALANLVDNAIKFSGDTRWLRVQAHATDGGVAIAVSDRGIGVPREEAQKIFEKFYRVGRSDTQARRGSGVGLALVKHVAEAHGGRISVESEAGRGSTFTLWLPR
jgi:signal transduction histidine kinase